MGTARLSAVGFYLEFLILRNCRVVLAKVRGLTMVALGRFGGERGRELAGRPRRSVYGIALAANFDDKTFRYCLYGTYGSHLSGYLAAIDRAFVFVDVGANQGLFTLVAARNPHCRRVIALEPVAATFALLARNIALNGCADKVTPIRAALSNRTGVAEIGIRRHHSGMASLEAARRKNLDGRETVRLIDAAELDPIIPRGIDIVVKVDVEGHEAVVLGELLRSAHSQRLSAVFYENDERWSDVPRMRAMLEQAAFTRFRKFGIRRHYDMLAER